MAAMNWSAEYQHIYLAPDPLAAVLACGGMMAQQGSAGQHSLLVQLDTAERAAALSSSDQHHRHMLRDLDVTPARLHLSDDQPPHDAVRSLIGRLRQRYPQASIYAPLGVISCPLRRLTCLATAECGGNPVIWYEDHLPTLHAAALHQRLSELGWRLIAQTIVIDSAFPRKLAALRCADALLLPLIAQHLGRPTSRSEALREFAARVRAEARLAAPPHATYAERVWQFA